MTFTSTGSIQRITFFRYTHPDEIGVTPEDLKIWAG
jgi:hypothetical protein